MTGRIKLRKFQKDSATEIAKIISSPSKDVPPLYAVADQVGLGKTWIVADAICQKLNLLPTNKPNIFIFYIAPSQELLRQNLPKFARYLINESNKSKRNNGKYWVVHYTSRISQILLDQQKHIKEGHKYHIHIVGLSSGVSFKLNGTGTASERALIAASLSYNPNGKVFKNYNLETEFFNILNTLLLLDKKRKRDWAHKVKEFRKDKDLMKQMSKIISGLKKNEIEREFKEKKDSAKHTDRLLVRILRKHITQGVLKELPLENIILDEWHRYREICVQNLKKANILYDSLKGIRNDIAKTRSALFVSATPFVVKFDDEDGREDLKILCQIIYGEETGKDLFEDIGLAQEKFNDILAKAVLNTIEQGTINKSDKPWQELLEKRNVLQGLIRKIAIRNQRPHFKIALEDNASQWTQEKIKSWKSVDFLGYLANKEVHFPLVNIWSDSRKFPNEKTYEIYKYWKKIKKQKLLKEDHWKISYIKDKLSKIYGKYIVGGGIIPPLWISSKDPQAPEKHLIFSSYTVTPKEIAGSIEFGSSFERGRTSEYSGSILGSFPFEEKNSLTKQKNNWGIFYPFLTSELLIEQEIDPQSIFSQIKTSKDGVEISQIELFLIFEYEGLKKINSPFKDLYLERLENRANQVFCENFESSELLRNYKKGELKFTISDGLKDNLVRFLRKDSPGNIFSRALGGFFQKETVRELYKNHKRKDALEENILRASESLLRLFSNPEAQYLHEKYSKLKNNYMDLLPSDKYGDFVYKYCKHNHLEDTLKVYFEILFRENPDHLDDIFSAFRNAVTLNKGGGLNRYARAFTDTSEKDLEFLGKKNYESDEHVKISTIREAFNSPFPPYILASTSVGQEGIDFHHYCKNIIHWAPPSCPSVLEQREGRLDRYNSLQIREALKDKEAFEDDLGFSPDFVVLDQDGKTRLNKLNREVLYLPFSTQEKAWVKCRERSYLTGILVGSPEPSSLELKLKDLKEVCMEKNSELWPKILEAIADHSINLSPSS